MKTLLSLVALVLLVGCNSPTHYKIKPTTSRNTPLSKTNRVFIGISPDAKDAPNQSTGNSLAARCSNRFASVTASKEPADAKHNQEEAIQAGADLLFLPRVIWWDDNAPAWSSNPDRLELQIVTIDLANKTQIDSGSILITGPWWTLGSYSPGEFTDVACELYLRYLTGDLTKLEGTTSFKRLPK